MSEPIPTNSAGFGARVMAFVIDQVLLKAMYIFLLLLLADKFIRIVSSVPSDIFGIGVLYLAVFLLAFPFLHMMYFTLFHAAFGQTVGKMMMGIKVVGDDQKPAGLGAAFLRWSGYLLSLAPMALGFLWTAFDPDRRAWHDRLAGTRVISAENS